MIRSRTLVLLACPVCGHELGVLPRAQAWCVRKEDHPRDRRGPVLMIRKEDLL